MTKEQLIEVLDSWKYGNKPIGVVLDAVDAYSSASNSGKPIVSGSLPQSSDYYKCESCKEEIIPDESMKCPHCGNDA